MKVQGDLFVTCIVERGGKVKNLANEQGAGVPRK